MHGKGNESDESKDKVQGERVGTRKRGRPNKCRRDGSKQLVRDSGGGEGDGKDR